MLKVLNLINETKNGNETKAGNETNREDGKLMKPGKMGKLQGTPEKQKQEGNFGLKKDGKTIFRIAIFDKNDSMIMGHFLPKRDTILTNLIIALESVLN